MNVTAYDPGISGGRREDLRNVLTILEPEETPFTSQVRKGPAPKSTFIETLGDTLRKPRKGGSKEGTDGKGGNKSVKRQRFGTYVHREQDSFGVTDVQQIISERGGQAAVDNEYAWNKAKCLREMKRDIEAANMGDQDHQGGDDTNMITRGVFSWISATAQGNNAVPADFRTLTGAILSGVGVTIPLFDEDDLNGMLKTLKSVYGGKRNYQLIAGNNVVDTVDHFIAVDSTKTTRRVQEMADEHELSLMVKVFDSSFGMVEVIPEEFNKIDSTGNGDPNAAALLNMDLFHMDLFDALHTLDLPDLGGGPSGTAKVMWALLCDSPRGHGKIYNT